MSYFQSKVRLLVRAIQNAGSDPDQFVDLMIELSRKPRQMSDIMGFADRLLARGPNGIKETIENLSKSNMTKVLKACSAKKRIKKRLHVLSDVDDTLFASHVGGTDSSFPSKRLYPGVRELIDRLTKTGYFTLLSARPYFLRRVAKQPFGKKGPAAVPLLSPISSLLSGAVSTAKHYLPLVDDSIESYETLATNKTDAVRLYAQIYPEYSFLFFGDLGQGDLMTAIDLLNDPDIDIRGVVMHDVLRSQGLLSNLRAHEIQKLIQSINARNRRHLIIADNYFTASCKLSKLGFLGPRALSAVLRSYDKECKQKEHLYACKNKGQKCI